MSTDQQIEQEIQAKGLTAGPRLTPAAIEAAIASEHYGTAGDLGDKAIIKPGEQRHPASLDRTIICVLALRNGGRVVGINYGSVSSANYDADLGRKLARQKAVDQLWELMGFSLLDRLAAA